MKAEREVTSLKSNRLPYGYHREVQAPFEETVDKAKKALSAEGFGVLTEIDMKEKFREKLDVEFRKYVILGACNPSLAHNALEADFDIGLLLPCNVIVYENGNVTSVAAIDASRMLSIAENKELEETAATVNEKLKKAIDSV